MGTSENVIALALNPLNYLIAVFIQMTTDNFVSCPQISFVLAFEAVFEDTYTI